MNTVDDFGNVLFLVQVNQLEAEQVGQFHFIEVTKEDSNIVGVPILEFMMLKDSVASIWVKGFDYFCQSNTISKCFLELNNGWYGFMDNVFYPFLGLTDMAKVLVGLEELALLVHPIATFPAIASGLLALAAIALISSL